MAGGALGSVLVLALMAGNTGHIPVLGLAGRQQIEGTVVTCSAEDGCSLVAVREGFRLMRLVASLAIRLLHLG